MHQHHYSHFLIQHKPLVIDRHRAHLGEKDISQPTSRPPTGSTWSEAHTLRSSCLQVYLSLSTALPSPLRLMTSSLDYDSTSQLHNATISQITASPAAAHTASTVPPFHHACSIAPQYTCRSSYWLRTQHQKVLTTLHSYNPIQLLRLQLR